MDAAARAAKRAADNEQKLRRRIERALPLLSKEDRSKIGYIHSQLDRTDRDPRDITLLREVRTTLTARHIKEDV